MAQPSVESVQSDAAYMKDFKASQTYDIWYKYLDLMADDIQARLINQDKAPLDELRLYQGMLQGIKMAAEVPDNVDRMAKQLVLDKTVKS